MLQPKISPFKDIGHQKMGSKSHNHCVRPVFGYGIVSIITVLENVITKIQRVQNSFIRLALRLPKYVSARLVHEASGGPKPLIARIHATPSLSIQSTKL